ncbi:MAG: polysaccharide deacetylase family protein [Ruminococcus sp.]|nr:polysaccharide deacetylase family protein [Ruminococcus sp.]
MIKNRMKSFFVMILIFALVFCFLITDEMNFVETSKSADNDVILPIIMYHSLLKDTSLHNNYTVSPTLLEDDLKYLTQNNYTTITVTDLLDYVYNDNPLPEKCIMLTFDDGYYNNYHYAFPLLKKYECKAVISPIAVMTEFYTQNKEVSLNYGHITVDNIKEMVESGFVEIQNHSYDMHKLKPRIGIDKKSGETFESYESTIKNDIMTAQNYLKDNAGVSPQCFVYPFGAKCEDTEKIVKELGFKCTLTCTEELNHISKSEDSLLNLGRYRRDNSESMESLINRIYK